MTRRFRVLAFVCAGSALPGSALPETLNDAFELAGVRVDYRVVLPDGYDPDRDYPAVLAFPGAGQTIRNVDRMLENNWRKEAERLGFIVISPAAPEQGLYFQGGDVVFPDFLEFLLRRYNITARKFHVAGVSNGGASAFHVAAAYPEYFWSVTGLPGYLPYLTAAKINSLAALCIYMHVGENDTDWIDTMVWQAQQLTDAGAHVRFWIEKGQNHVMDSLAGPGARRLFDHFIEAAAGC